MQLHLNNSCCFTLIPASNQHILRLLYDKSVNLVGVSWNQKQTNKKMHFVRRFSFLKKETMGKEFKISVLMWIICICLLTNYLLVLFSHVHMPPVNSFKIQFLMEFLKLLFALILNGSFSIGAWQMLVLAILLDLCWTLIFALLLEGSSFFQFSFFSEKQNERTWQGNSAWHSDPLRESLEKTGR